MHRWGGTCIVQWCFPYGPCDPCHNLWQPDTLVNTTDGQEGDHFVVLRCFLCGAALLGAVHCTALCVPCCTVVVGRGQWAVELVHHTATPPGGCGQWNSCYALPHCLGAVGSATPALHCHIARGQWVVQLLQYTCLTARGRWAVELLLNAASVPRGSGQWSSRSCRNASLLCLGAVGNATPALHCLTVWGQWAVELLQYTASPPGGSGRRYSCNTRPHRLGAVGNATPAIRCLSARGPWPMELLQYTASLLGGSGQWISHSCCNALLLCLGAVGSATPALHCLSAWG